MEYRRLGRSGLKVSVVSLGSWLTYGKSVDDDRARECLRTAIEGGVNFIDTADVYARGAAEEFLGRALGDYRREHLVLGTKLFWPMSDDVNDRGLSRKHVMESCEASLRRLKTDYIDLYQCHRFDPETPVEETVRAMDDLARQGKILYWGVSCWEPDQLLEATDAARRLLCMAPVSNQPPYNMLQREIEASVIPVSRRHGISQVVFSPLCEGLLTGKYAGGAVPEGSRLADERVNRFLREKATPARLAAVERLASIASDLSLELPVLALAWCLRQSNVSSVITGASRPEQVRQNLRAAEVTLDEETLERIDAALAEAS